MDRKILETKLEEKTRVFSIENQNNKLNNYFEHIFGMRYVEFKHYKGVNDRDLVIYDTLLFKIGVVLQKKYPVLSRIESKVINKQYLDSITQKEVGYIFGEFITTLILQNKYDHLFQNRKVILNKALQKHLCRELIIFLEELLITSMAIKRFIILSENPAFLGCFNTVISSFDTVIAEIIEILEELNFCNCTAIYLKNKFLNAKLEELFGIIPGIDSEIDYKI